jgi:dihydroxy-acid dehydratase
LRRRILAPGLAVLFGNIALDGAVVKQSAVAPEMLRHTGPARVFDGEEEAINAIFAGRSSPATSLSFGTKAPAADPACGKCSCRTSPLPG